MVHGRREISDKESNLKGEMNIDNCKPQQAPFTGDWIHKMWCIYTLECYLSLKGKEILAYTTAWMSLEDSKLFEMHQTQKRGSAAAG